MPYNSKGNISRFKYLFWTYFDSLGFSMRLIVSVTTEFISNAFCQDSPERQNQNYTSVLDIYIISKQMLKKTCNIHLLIFITSQGLVPWAILSLVSSLAGGPCTGEPQTLRLKGFHHISTFTSIYLIWIMKRLFFFFLKKHLKSFHNWKILPNQTACLWNMVS